MSKDRQTVPAAGTWGEIVGYSRAVRVGQTIHVAGTTSPGDDVGAQTAGALEIAINAITELGGTREDVVRTRLFLTNIDEWEAAGRAHGEFFAGVNPTTTLLEVSRLIDADLLVEVEVEAILPEGR